MGKYIAAIYFLEIYLLRHAMVIYCIGNEVETLSYDFSLFLAENGDPGDLSDYTVKLEDVNRENLNFMFDNLWRHRNTLKKDYQGIIDRERALAKQHFDLICHTLREKKAV